MTKNALAYICRKRNRSIIAFILITLVLSSLYSCFYVAKSIDGVERSIYRLSNSSISIAKKNAKDLFKKEELKALKSIKNIDEITTEYNGTAKLTSGNVFAGNQKVQRDDVPQDLKNLVAIESTSNTKKNILFNSRSYGKQEKPALPQQCIHDR